MYTTRHGDYYNIVYIILYKYECYVCPFIFTIEHSTCNQNPVQSRNNPLNPLFAFVLPYKYTTTTVVVAKVVRYDYVTQISSVFWDDKKKYIYINGEWMKNSDREFRWQWEVLKIKNRKTSGYVIYFPLYIVVFGDKMTDS